MLWHTLCYCTRVYMANLLLIFGQSVLMYDQIKTVHEQHACNKQWYKPRNWGRGLHKYLLSGIGESYSIMHFKPKATSTAREWKGASQFWSIMVAWAFKIPLQLKLCEWIEFVQKAYCIRLVSEHWTETRETAIWKLIPHKTCCEVTRCFLHLRGMTTSRDRRVHQQREEAEGNKLQCLVFQCDSAKFKSVGLSPFLNCFQQELLI